MIATNKRWKAYSKKRFQDIAKHITKEMRSNEEISDSDFNKSLLTGDILCILMGPICIPSTITALFKFYSGNF
jgi:hypothetical protein